jgi:hypothetical protein
LSWAVTRSLPLAKLERIGIRERIYDKVANGETQLRLGRKGTREPHCRLLFADDVWTQQFFVTAEGRLVVAIRPVQLLRNYLLGLRCSKALVRREVDEMIDGLEAAVVEVNAERRAVRRGATHDGAAKHDELTNLHGDCKALAHDGASKLSKKRE